MAQSFKYRPWPLGAWEEWKYKMLCALVALPGAVYAGWRIAERYVPPGKINTAAANQIYWLKWSAVAVGAGLIVFLALNPVLRLLGRFYTRRAARGNLPGSYWRSIPEAPLDPQWVALLNEECPADLVRRSTSFHQLRLARTHPEVIDLGIPDTFWAENEPPALVLSTWQRVASVAQRLPKPLDSETGAILRRCANYVPLVWLESCQTPQDLAAQVARAEAALKRRGVDPKTLTRPSDAAGADELTIAAGLLPESFYRPPGVNDAKPWPEAHLGWCWPRIRKVALALPGPLAADDGLLLRRCAHLLPLPWLERCGTREDLRQKLEVALRALKDLGVSPDAVPDASRHQTWCDQVEVLGYVYQTCAASPALLAAALQEARRLDVREALTRLRRGEGVPQLQRLTQVSQR